MHNLVILSEAKDPLPAGIIITTFPRNFYRCTALVGPGH